LIGNCGLHYLENGPDVELTYTIQPFYWGQGLATEASRAVLSWGFKTLQLKQIVAVTGPANGASQRVMQKLGMKYQQNIQYNGTEVVYYAISRNEFELSQSCCTHQKG
jgi:ribosomal-protein-alanine N-acetyltransferase